MSTKKQRKGANKNLEGIVPIPEPSEISIDPPKQENKYWIKNGEAVRHIDYPELKMRVMEVKKFTKELKDGSGQTKPVTFVRGVVCTWLDRDGKFQKGMFHTREIQPWSKKD